MAGLDRAYAWPEAAHLVAQRHRARAAVAQQALDKLHLTRLGSGAAAALVKAAAVVRAEPRVLLTPAAWLRIGFAMLPAGLIQRLRQRRRAAGRVGGAAE
jgi:hypothetical protein